MRSTIFLAAVLSLAEAVPNLGFRTVSRTLHITSSFGESVQQNENVRLAMAKSVETSLGPAVSTLQFIVAPSRRMQDVSSTGGYQMVVEYKVDCGDFGDGQSACSGIVDQAGNMADPPTEHPLAAAEAAQQIIDAINTAAAASDVAVGTAGAVVTSTAEQMSFTAPITSTLGR